ncbi:MAG: mucoidy inhibitor MuiA family protein [Limimaricola sp.]|uniref:DUF4139 domain-containing protein n=1 Tax=Limimaricola sp. TaxID=2211665 RepID=UPI001D5FF15F|nr:DUF4139 domain-containing protein [Limimaricola sp.]MBI1418799.1 mucoidy inhibitor MuiA family protein [Limimaricola sp.]
MSRLLPVAALSAFILAPQAVLADTVTAASHVARVTLYPDGASIEREVTFAAAAGAHELVIAGLPLATDADTLRVAAADARIGAVTLRQGRLPPRDTADSAEIAAAKAEVDRLEAALRSRDAAIAEVRLRTDAAAERIAFLRKLGDVRPDGGLTTANVDDLRAMSRMIGDEVLAARTDALKAETEATEASLARDKDAKALDKARQVLAALTRPAPETAILTVTVDTASDGEHRLQITTFTGDASWQPVYDLRLTRGDSPTLALQRGALVSQYTGEDWQGVDLTLSTARPSAQADPSAIYPQLLRYGPPLPPAPAPAGSEAFSGALAKMDDAPVMAEPAPVIAVANFEGANVTYHYGPAVDIADGVEALRLNLDSLAFTPDLVAEAIPLQDSAAYLMASFTNDTAEPILPGRAVLFLDGAVTGATDLPLIPAGGELRTGFGAIDGLRLTRTVPSRSEGDRGLISKSNQIDEKALITVENLTQETWQMHVIDRVPYSEQDDLKITYTATPPATDTDLDGQRGLLAWDFPLAAGASQQIRLDHSVNWPAGQVLR